MAIVGRGRRAEGRRRVRTRMCTGVGGNSVTVHCEVRGGAPAGELGDKGGPASGPPLGRETPSRNS